MTVHRSFTSSPTTITAYRDGIHHPEHVAGNWEFDGYKLIERWWMDQDEA